MARISAEQLAAADAAVAEVINDKLYGPLDYSRRQFERVAMMFVVQGEGARHLRISTDGLEPQNVPKDLVRVIQRAGQFLLATLLGKHVIEFKFRQGRVPVLSKTLKWTKEQVAQWRDLRPHLQSLRDALLEERRIRKRQPKTYARGRFGEGA